MTLGAGAAALVDNSVDRNSNDPRPVLIVTGLVQEARIAAGPGMIVICSSSDPQQLRALLATLDSSTFRGVISFGVAGGLDPSLKSGDVVVATEVLAGDTRFLAGLALNEELIARAALRRRRVVRGGLAGVEQVIAATACKAALHSETGAAAVDMESHIAAAYAAKAGLPFAALRVISDPASRALPALAKSAIKPNGDIDLGKVLRGVARNPTSLRALVSTGLDFNRALRSLRGCRGFLHGEEGLATADDLIPASAFRISESTKLKRKAPVGQEPDLKMAACPEARGWAASSDDVPHSIAPVIVEPSAGR